jgi:hypothetical protein
LTDPVVLRQLGLITRRGRSLSPAAAQLHRFIADVKPLAQTKKSAPKGAV